MIPGSRPVAESSHSESTHGVQPTVAAMKSQQSAVTSRATKVALAILAGLTVIGTVIAVIGAIGITAVLSPFIIKAAIMVAAVALGILVLYGIYKYKLRCKAAEAISSFEEQAAGRAFSNKKFNGMALEGSSSSSSSSVSNDATSFSSSLSLLVPTAVTPPSVFHADNPATTVMLTPVPTRVHNLGVSFSSSSSSSSSAATSGQTATEPMVYDGSVAPPVLTSEDQEFLKIISAIVMHSSTIKDIFAKDQTTLNLLSALERYNATNNVSKAKEVIDECQQHIDLDSLSFFQKARLLPLAIKVARACM